MTEFEKTDIVKALQSLTESTSSLISCTTIQIIIYSLMSWKGIKYVMFYFKFKDKNGIEMYGAITVENVDIAPPEQKTQFIEDLKKLCHAETLEEVSKEEYDVA